MEEERSIPALISDTGITDVILCPPHRKECSTYLFGKLDTECDCCRWQRVVVELQGLRAYRITPELKKE